MTAALWGLLVALVSAVGGYAYGEHQGKLLEAGARDGKALEQVADMLTSHQALVKAAAQASKDLARATQQRAGQDAQTTQELRNALQATAPVRADCVFDAGVLRQLATARERAADAAARGIRATVPGTASGAH